MRRVNPREARRMMHRMGLNMVPLEVEEAILRTKDKEIVIEKPEVAILEVQGQKVFQLAGGKTTERTLRKETTIPEEDIQLVAMQANATSDQARAALEQSKGDLAQAILLLTQK